MHEHNYNHEQYATPLYFQADDVGSIGIGKVWAKVVNVLSFGGILSGGGAAEFSHILIWLLFHRIIHRSATSEEDTNKT